MSASGTKSYHFFDSFEYLRFDTEVAGGMGNPMIDSYGFYDWWADSYVYTGAGLAGEYLSSMDATSTYQSDARYVQDIYEDLGHSAGSWVYLYPKVAWAVWDSAQDAWGYDTQFMGPHFTTQEHQGIDGDGGAYQYAWDCDDDDNTLFARAAGYDPDYFKNCQAPIYNWGASFLDYGDGPYAVQPMYTGIVECWGSGDRCSTAHRDDESGPYYKLYGPLTGDLLEDPLFSNYEVLHQISSIQIKMDSNEVNLLGERFAPLKVSTLTDPVEIFKSYAVATEEESEEKTFTPIPKKIKSSLQLTFSGLEGEKASTENLVVSATSGRTSSTSATY